MKKDLHLDESNIKGYFEGKLGSAIKSLKGFLYTVVGVWITVAIFFVVIFVVVASAGSGGGSQDGMIGALLGASAVGIVAGIALIIMFISHFVFNITGALKFSGLFNLLNSNQSSSKIAKTSGQMLELTNAIKNVRNCLGGNLGVFVLAIIVSQGAALGFLLYILSFVLFIMSGKYKNQLVRFREEGSI